MRYHRPLTVLTLCPLCVNVLSPLFHPPPSLLSSSHSFLSLPSSSFILPFSEEGGHPDGSPLLRLTNTDKLGRPSKQSRGSSSLMYQDGSEDGSHSEYYGGNSGGSEFVMFPGYDESHYKPVSVCTSQYTLYIV